MCESSDRETIELGTRWSVVPGRERNGNVMLQLTLAIFPVFFPELILNTMVFNLSHYLTIRN